MLRPCFRLWAAGGGRWPDAGGGRPAAGRVSAYVRLHELFDLLSGYGADLLVGDLAVFEQ